MKVERALEEHGLLLQQDKKLPSVVGLIAGGALSSSWWSHPKAQEIFATLERLTDRDDVLVTRLIGGKVTFVHKRLWPAFLAVATSGEAWQRKGLSAAAKTLLASVARKGVARAKGDAARELQERLLVAATEVHTESGQHEIELQSWSHWSKGRGVTAIDDVRAAREELERVVSDVGARPSVLPWRRFAAS